MARPREFDEDVALAGAMQVFWQRGYGGAGIQELCRAMGLNPGSVYGAYGSKHGLFITIVRRYLDMVASEGIEQIARQGSGLDGIRGYFLYIVSSIIEGRRCWGCLGTNAIMERGEHDIAVRNLMNEHLKRLEDAFRIALDRHASEGQTSACVQADAHYLVCVAQGLNVMARTSPSRASLMAIVDRALCALQAGRHHSAPGTDAAW